MAAGYDYLSHHLACLLGHSDITSTQSTLSMICWSGIRVSINKVTTLGAGLVGTLQSDHLLFTGFLLIKLLAVWPNCWYSIVQFILWENRTIWYVRRQAKSEIVARILAVQLDGDLTTLRQVILGYYGLLEILWINRLVPGTPPPL